MNRQQIADYCERYFAATGSHIIEKAPAHMKVKLSPEADRALTGRTYYWNFIERTGAEAETMSFKFTFDLEAASPRAVAGPGRMLEEAVVYGSRRLDQIFDSAFEKGRYLQLFEEPPALPAGTAASVPYFTWLGVNYKIDFICDMKKEEMHSLGICMSTGEIVDDFERRAGGRKLSPRLPARTMLRETISLDRAAQALEARLESHLSGVDYGWATEAIARMNEELQRIDSYYGELLQAASEPEQQDELKRQYQRRKEEIEWQYHPRIEAHPINCGFYHLLTDNLRFS